MTGPDGRASSARLRRKGGLRGGPDRARSGQPRMIPLRLFLLACAAVYLGTIEAAFSALMRLSLRLMAERSGRPIALGSYLDDPLLLFMPVRLLLGLVTGAATELLAVLIGVDGHRIARRSLLAVRRGRSSSSASCCCRCSSSGAIPSACSRCCCRRSRRSRARSGR